MENLEKYLDYYFLEDYIFNEIHKNFQEHGHLLPEEFFAIVIWKRNASKTKIIKGLKKDGRSILEITSKISAAKTREGKLNILLLPKIEGIAISFASAILSVLYPDDFTVADYRAYTSLKYFGGEINSNPTSSLSAYFKYLDECKILAHKYGFSLRDFDRILWSKDFYDGVNGLKSLVKGMK